MSIDITTSKNNDLYSYINKLVKTKSYKKMITFMVYWFIFCSFALIAYLIFCVYMNKQEYWIYIIVFILDYLISPIAFLIYLKFYFKNLLEIINHELNGLYFLYKKKQSKKELTFKPSKKFKQKKYQDFIKSISDYYYEELTKYFDTI